MILVTGATGKLGTTVVQTLLDKTSPDQVAALVRDETKAEGLKARGVDVRVGTYDDVGSLERAMGGVETVLLIAGTDEENRVRQHQNVVDAAKQAGVGCVAYTSRALRDRSKLANKLMAGHFQTEDLIKASGLAYTVFRNVLYMDAAVQFVGDNVFDAGIFLPAGQGRVAYALRSELGEGIANALLNGCDNKTYHLTGSEAYSFGDVASTLSSLSGKKVAYTPAETSAFGARLKERGLPETMVQRIIGFMTDIKNGQEGEVSPDLENLLGRKPVTLQAGLKALYNL